MHDMRVVNVLCLDSDYLSITNNTYFLQPGNLCKKYSQVYCPLACFRLTSISHKWKSHFFEMKGDVGMADHEKK